MTKESKIFIRAKLTVSKSCLYLDHKISFNLSVEVAIFLAFHNPFMMLFHILMSVLDHELMLDNFLITSSVCSYSQVVFENQIDLFRKEILLFILHTTWFVPSWDCTTKSTILLVYKRFLDGRLDVVVNRGSMIFLDVVRRSSFASCCVFVANFPTVDVSRI